ncbi:MAG: MOSC domain-containing protein [Candidatus Aenigmarchaeota archaeon]|nr:MOSC domain-containing protein [Candidatus Aenigmarchaeota archaeon]
MQGKIYQINIKPEVSGEHGLPKRAIDSALITIRGVAGDFNRYRYERNNDNPDNALLLMPIEMIAQLTTETWPLQPGDLGENVTTSGIQYNEFAVGKKYRLGECEIQISKPCTPCKNLYLLPYIGKEKGPEFLRTILGRRGWYARVLKEGVVTKGNSIEEIV